MTAHNAAGVAIGVDVLQAAFANTTVVGLNSLLLVRATAADPYTTSAEAAVRYVAAAVRGVPFIYPLMDASGDGRVIEAGPADVNCTSTERGTCNPPDMRSLVAAENATLAAALPAPATINATLGPTLDYRKGVYVRKAGVPLPLMPLLTSYNPHLFALAGVPYRSDNATWGPGGSVWNGFADESIHFSAIARKYFSPDRFESPPPGVRAMAVSNLALYPQLRIAGMTFWTSIEEMGRPQWRYDALAAAVRRDATAGNITFDSAKELITFLGPTRSPGFSNYTTIEGIITVVDLVAGRLAAMGGYWGDDWSHVTLKAYVPSAAMAA